MMYLLVLISSSEVARLTLNSVVSSKLKKLYPFSYLQLPRTASVLTALGTTSAHSNDDTVYH